MHSRARRIPIIDDDDETCRPMVVSVITQYRILKFVAVNVHETQNLHKPIKDLNIGTYTGLKYAHLDTPVMDVIHMLVKKSISSIPILDKNGSSTLREAIEEDLLTSIGVGVVINVFEAVDVIPLIKGGSYEDLNLTVGEALLYRAEVLILNPRSYNYTNHIPGLSRNFYLHNGGSSRFYL